MSETTESLEIRTRILGQDRVFDQLDRAIENGRLAHAYLFLGPRGVGKTRTALALAQRLLSPDGDPSGLKKVARLSHPDLHLVFPMTKDEMNDPTKVGQFLTDYAKDFEAPLNPSPTATIGIDQIRNLKEQVAKAPVESVNRVLIWNSAGRLTDAAAQSSLKLVEEPPSHTTLILCAEDSGQLLPTLVSRCQRVQIRPLPARMVSEYLEEGGSDAREARILASLSGGSLSRAVQMRGEGILELRDQALQLFAVDGASASAIAQRVESMGRKWDTVRASRTVELLLMWYHDVLMVRSQLPSHEIIHSDRMKQLEQAAGHLTAVEIQRRIVILEELVESVRSFVNPALALHAALTKIATGVEAGETQFLGQ